MTLPEFNDLTYPQMVTAVLDAGDFLATRWKENFAINLYHLPNRLFAELYYDIHANQIVAVRAFTDAAPLEEYAANLPLPGGLDELEDS